MDFSHYTTQPVELAVALANTKGISTDSLADIGQLTEFLDEWKPLWEGVARKPTRGDLATIHEVREAIRQVIAAGDHETAAARVNSMLATYGATPRVSTHSGTAHLHFEPFDSSMPSFLGTVTAMGLASVLVESGVDRFGVCDSSTCEDVYVDTSRNRSRRHCSNTCSTREAVAAYRKRQSN